MFQKFYRASSKYQPVQAHLKNLLAIEILYFSHIFFIIPLKFTMTNLIMVTAIGRERFTILLILGILGM